MKRTFERYRNVGQRFVNGFLEPEILLALAVLDSAQRTRQISGSVAEIGVHHGKLFIGMHLLQRGAEKSMAIDIFGDQELNIDHSGNGNLDKFTANVEVWSSMDGVVIHQGDSTKLTADVVRQKLGSDVRFFSVDGGHTEEIVYSDMRLAEQVLGDGGVVIADDVFNEHWPGVAVGTLKYLEDGAGLAPFAIGFNKVFFTQSEHSDYYRAPLQAAFDRKVRLQAAESVYAGHDVTLLLPQGPVDILRKSETARAVYHGASREVMRGLQLVSGKVKPGR